ncbi:MAG TPA: PaaI family thioesterase [Thermoanaerobaculia bacterium]
MSRFAGLEPVPALAPDLLERLRRRLASSPALRWLEPTLDELELDSCVLGLRYRPELTNGSATIHGGVLATLADTAVAFALSTNFDGKMGFATADMTIHFLRRAKSDLRARARIVKKGRRINVGEVEVVDSDDFLVARALTSFLLTTSSFDYLPGEKR